jgi:SAM-dependent methyltransferase
VTDQPEPVDDILPAQDSLTPDPALVARHQRLADLLDVRPGQVVVDLGCGDGVALGCVLERLGSRPGGAAVGLDRDTDALGRAAKALAAPDRSGCLLLAAADLGRGVPLRDGSVDRVLSHNLLECLPDPAAFMAEAHRLLRPGGLLVLGHADFDTLVFNGADLHLSRRLVHAYCDTQQPWMAAADGTIGRRLHALAARSPLRLRTPVAWVLVSTAWKPGMLGHAYAHHVVDALRGHPACTTRERAAWLADLEAAAGRGAFLFSLNEYVAMLVREPSSTDRDPSTTGGEPSSTT